jgi:hypothetical protein
MRGTDRLSGALVLLVIACSSSAFGADQSALGLPDVTVTAPPITANFGVSDRRFRFKPAGGFGGNRLAVSVQSGTPLRMGFGPGFGEPPLRDTSYLALACQSKYSCHYYSF